MVGVGRIVPRERNAGLGQRMTQQPVMNTRRLHETKSRLAHKPAT